MNENTKKVSHRLFAELSNTLGPIVGPIAFQVVSGILDHGVTEKDVRDLHIQRSKVLEKSFEDEVEKRLKKAKG